MAEAFVSYASPDREIAFRIAAFLEERGIGCWIAPRDVPPGKDYGAAILEGIENSRVLVLILSEESNSSAFVQKEVERAVSKAKAVLPVRIREVTPSGSLEFFVSSAQWVDAWRSPMEQHLSKLADAILAMRGDGAPVAPVPLPTPPARRSRTPILLGVAVGLIIAGSVAAWAWKPWLPAWQRSAPDFLAGSWCLPMSGEAISRSDFRKAGADTVAIEVHFSHSTQVNRLKARVEPAPDGFTLNWTEPPEAVGGDPETYRVLDDISIGIVPAAGEDMRVLTRCPLDSGGR